MTIFDRLAKTPLPWTKLGPPGCSDPTDSASVARREELRREILAKHDQIGRQVAENIAASADHGSCPSDLQRDPS